MTQDLTNFLPEMWSKKLAQILDKSGVMMQCVNRNYEGEIKNAGDTVKIRSFGSVTVKDYTGTISYDDLESPLSTLNIDQKKYFAFKVDDISKAQADVDIMEGYLGRAKSAIDLTKDSFLLAKHADVPADNIIGSEGSPIALSSSNIYENFVKVGKALKNANAVKPGQTPFVVINPDVEALLIQAPEFTRSTESSDRTIREGSIGRIAGMDVLVCTNLVPVDTKTYILAGTNDAVTFASQVVQVEKIRLQDSFDTAVRGLYVYGAKTILPEALGKIIATV